MTSLSGLKKAYQEVDKDEPYDFYELTEGHSRQKIGFRGFDFVFRAPGR